MKRLFHKRWSLVWLVAVLLAGVFLRDVMRSRVSDRVIRIAIDSGPQSGLVYLAQKMGYFEDVGVRVELQQHASYEDAAAVLDAKGADLAALSDSLVVEKFVKGDPVVILSQLHNAQRHSGIVVRRSSGIVRLKDLRGRRLAVSGETALQYFMAQSFLTHSLSPEAVKIVEMSADEAVAAFLAGKVEALAAHRNGILKLEDKIGSNALRVIDTSTQIDASVLVGMKPTVRERRTEIEAVMRALVMAYDFYLERRDDAYLALLEVMKERLTPSHMMQVWAFMNLDLSLSNVLLMNLREQQGWFEEKSGVKDDADIESSFANGLLRQVRPDLVTIM